MAKITDYGVQGQLYLRIQNTPISILLDSLAIIVPSNLPAGSTEKFPFLGTTPSMREWIKQRQVHSPQSFDYQIPNKKFELTEAIPLDWVNNDKLGQIQDLIGSMAMALPLWKRELLAALIVAASTTKCFDGQNFVSAAHTYGKTGVFSNLTTYGCASAGVPTPLEAAKAINQSIELMKLQPDDQGRAIINEAMTSLYLLYAPGTSNAPNIVSGINNKLLSTGTGMIDNPLLGQSVKITAMASGLLKAYPNTKFMLVRPPTDLGKPFLFQENTSERRIDVVTTGEYVVLNDEWLVGYKTVGNVGYGLPQHVMECTFT